MEYVLESLGFFSESAMKGLKKKAEGKTFMEFRIKWSNCAGNCTLIVVTDFFDGLDVPYEEQKQYVCNVLMHFIISET